MFLLLQEENRGGAAPDSEEGTLQIAPSRGRPGRMARVLADTQDTLGPSQASEPVAAPEEATNAAAPRQATDAAAPEQATEAASPEQATDAAAPEHATEAAPPEQATDAAVPEQAAEAASLEQATDAAAPEQATEVAPPEQATDAAGPEQALPLASAAEVGPGGWRVRKKPAPQPQNASADAPTPSIQNGTTLSGHQTSNYIERGTAEHFLQTCCIKLYSCKPAFARSFRSSNLRGMISGWALYPAEMLLRLYANSQVF